MIYKTHKSMERSCIKHGHIYIYICSAMHYVLYAWISYNIMVLTLLFNQIQQLPSHLRSQAADTLYFEAQYRLQDPVYGCVGIISQLHQQINSAESQVAKIQAEIAFLNSNAQEVEEPQVDQHIEANSNFINNLLPEQINTLDLSPYGLPSTQTSWFN